MNQPKIQSFLFQNINALKGVGEKTKKLLKKKKIERISDLLWNFPYGHTDRSNIKNLDELEVGKIATIKVKVVKYNFPRIRNLPSKVSCEDEKGKVDVIFFNSREGYIKNILPLNKHVVISGKVNYFKKTYQITNPPYVVPSERENYVNKIIPKYSLTEGLTEKIYRKLIEQVLNNIKDLNEWHNINIVKKIGNVGWSESVVKIHDNNGVDLNSLFYRRLAYDEILANFIVLSEVRKKIKRIKKKKKTYKGFFFNKIIKSLEFTLTKGQKKIIDTINFDLKSEFKMFRLLQGDVGSGKTIVAFLAAANVIESKNQVAFMAPTEILAKQHFYLAKKIFKNTNIIIEFISGKTDLAKKKKIQSDLAKGKINFLIGTHALFQKNITFNKLGLAIIDEQHKFGVKQRIELSNKGGVDCDILLMSATPIPRTLVLAFYGDMDVSKLTEKPKSRKNTITISKPEEKLNEVLVYIKKEITAGNQVFWVCPLIEESKKLDYAAAVKKYEDLSKLFPKKVGLIHGAMNSDDKNLVLKNFLDKNIKILVSTTIIEVGVDFPSANIIVIENSNKFGLSQLHQLRGRVGRGYIQATCILLYKKNLSENAKKRIRILKSSNDGFFIAEEDMKLRGYGDILGYQQSGVKYFRLADPVKHQDLFELAEKDIKNIENNESSFKKYDFLLKLFDKAEIINQLD